MSAPLFVISPEVAAVAVTGGDVVLDGQEGRHAVSVTRLAVGERVDLADGVGVLLRCRVAEVVGRDSLRADVLERVDEPEPQPRVVVVQALAKGDRGETAVETLTEVGVDEIVPWQAQRSIVRWSGDKVARGRARWESVAFTAGKQARRARFPQVGEVALRTSDVVGRVQSAALAVVLHEEASAPLGALEVPAAGEVVLIVGPEGGVSPEELEALVAAGAVAARLGPSVLRTSTAGTVAAGIVLSRTPRWP